MTLKEIADELVAGCREGQDWPASSQHRPGSSMGVAPTHPQPDHPGPYP